MPATLLLLLAVVFATILFAMSVSGEPPVNLDTYLYPHDDLGAVYSPQETSFKLWAPTAKRVSVVLFDDATDNSSKTSPMERDADGIWSAAVKGDLDGKYYLFDVSRESAGTNDVIRAIDPYARGSSANSGRALIYDSRKTDP
jgi:1,4-alpha-glucan branching enzyme